MGLVLLLRLDTGVDKRSVPGDGSQRGTHRIPFVLGVRFAALATFNLSKEWKHLFGSVGSVLVHAELWGTLKLFIMVCDMHHYFMISKQMIWAPQRIDCGPLFDELSVPKGAN